MRWISFLLKLSRPFYLLGSILLYSLGGGVAKYLGVTIHWNIYFLGLGWVFLLQIASFALYEYFEPADYPSEKGATNLNHTSRNETQKKNDSLARLVVCFTCLTVAGSFSILIKQANQLSPVTGVIMAVALIGGVFYSLPPVRLSTSGYGEMMAAIIFANAIPAFAFALQAGDMHRLIAMTTFPLTPLILAMIVAFQFPTYSHDLKQGKRKLMIRMGWQNAMNLHNILIVCAYLLLAIAIFFQLPIFIGAPVFLTLPLGFLQMWQMKRITDGVKPNWQALTISWIVLSYTVVYLLAYSFWIH